MLDTRIARRPLAGPLALHGGPWPLVNAVLLAAIATAGVAAYFVVGRRSSPQGQVTTATVQRGSVLSTVSASGNVQPAKTLSLGFSSGGRLVAIYVEPGEHVRKGQALARLDDTDQAAAVRTARANLASARANLQSLLDPLTPATRRQNRVAVEQASAQIAAERTALGDTIANAAQDRRSLEKTVAEAKASLEQAQRVAATNEQSLRTAVGEAKGAWLEAKAAAGHDQASLQAAIDQAQAKLQRDQAQLQADQQQLASDQNDASTYTAQVSGYSSVSQSLQSQVDDDKDTVTSLQVQQIKCNKTTPPCNDSAKIQIKLTEAQAQEAADQSKLSDAQSSLSGAQSKLDAATNAVKSDQAAIVADQNTLATDQEAITNAQNALSSGRAKDAQSVNQAYRSYVNSKQSLKSGLATSAQSIQNAQKAVKDAVASLNAGVVKDRQSVHTARASVKSAQEALASTQASNAAKAAPATAGALASARAQIASAEAALENALAAERQTILRAPAAGTVATLNGEVGETIGAGGGSASAGGSSSSSSSSTSSAGSSSSAFLTLVDLNRPEVLADFSETDAAKIRAGQPATITVDALPGKEFAAHVVGVDTTQTVVNNVVTYGVTFVLDRPATQLKPGMTVSATVIVGRRDGVLHVPNAAVRTAGGQSYVTVVGANGAQRQQPVQTGLVGDDSTEILAGLHSGQRVVVATASAAATTGAGGGGGGVGGGRFGGGGGGAVFRFGGP